MAEQTTLSPVEEIAYSFIDAANRLQSVREESAEAVLAAAERSAALWVHFQSKVAPTALDLTNEGADLIAKISHFMFRSAMALRNEASTDLVDRMIDMNLKMSEQILAAPRQVH